jgi:hypothetical protein
MAYKQLSDDAALALNGTTDPATGLVFPRLLERNWGADTLRAIGQFLRVFPSDLRVMEIQDNPDAVGVLPGVCTIGGVLLDYAGSAGAPVLDGPLKFPNNAVSFVWAFNNAGVIGFDSGAAWPGTTHLKLARITMDAGAIVQNKDFRAAAMLSV